MKKNCTIPRILWKFIFVLFPFTIFIVWQIRFSKQWLPVQWRSVSIYQLHPDWFLVHPHKIGSHMSKLPNLTAIEWPVEEVAPYPIGRKTAGGPIEPLPRAFEPSMSRGQRRLFRDLLETFSDLMFAHEWGDRFMLYGGTLLGSLRHHDFIPWDDDIDVLVDITVRSSLRAAMKQLEPRYIFSGKGARNKFHAQFINASDDHRDLALSRHTSSYQWGWPYLDIAYYTTNGTHVWEAAKSYGRYYIWPIQIVFPLYFRPFGKHWFPAPRDSVTFTRLTYDLSKMCTVFGYSHIIEGKTYVGSVPCQDLGFRYAFVYHKPCKEQINRVVDHHRMSLGEERLIIRTNVTDFAVIHSFCVAVDASNVEVDKYSLAKLHSNSGGTGYLVNNKWFLIIYAVYHWL